MDVAIAFTAYSLTNLTGQDMCEVSERFGAEVERGQQVLNIAPPIIADTNFSENRHKSR